MPVPWELRACASVPRRRALARDEAASARGARARLLALRPLLRCWRRALGGRCATCDAAARCGARCSRACACGARTARSGPRDAR